MSTSATSPSNDPSSYSLFGIDTRLIPIIAALIAFGIFVLLFLAVTATVLHFRRMHGLIDQPPVYPTRRRRRFDSEDSTSEPLIKPLMRTVDIEVDLEIGENSNWRNVMPLGGEWEELHEKPPPYKTKDDDNKGDKNLLDYDEDRYVRVTMLIALPSKRHRQPKDQVIVEACVPHSFHNDEEDFFPETAIGVSNATVSH